MVVRGEWEDLVVFPNSCWDYMITKQRPLPQWKLMCGEEGDEGVESKIRMHFASDLYKKAHSISFAGFIAIAWFLNFMYLQIIILSF